MATWGMVLLGRNAVSKLVLCQFDVTAERAKYYQDMHEAERKQAAILDHYRTGSFIMHPRFGRGRIVEIVGADINRYALVDFKDMETKKLSLTWVDKNCGRCA